MKRITALILTVFLLLGLIPAVMAADTGTANVTDFSNLTSEELLLKWTQLGVTIRAYGIYPFSELEKGDTGYEVTASQTQLAALGYYQKEIVDNFGNGTYNALREFEKASGLTVNGIASAEDQQALYAAVAIANGTISADELSGNSTVSSYSPQGLLEMWLEIGALLRTDGSYPYEELEKGNVGYEVTMLQTRLQELGYYSKEVVDNFGNGTYDAMRSFEKQNGLTVNGVASAEDQQLLFSSAASAYVQQVTTTTTTNNNQKTDGTSSATK